MPTILAKISHASLAAFAKILVLAHCYRLSVRDGPPVGTTQYCFGIQQYCIRKSKVEQIIKAGAAKPAVTKWVHQIVIFTKDMSV